MTCPYLRREEISRDKMRPILNYVYRHGWTFQETRGCLNNPTDSRVKQLMEYSKRGGDGWRPAQPAGAAGDSGRSFSRPGGDSICVPGTSQNINAAAATCSIRDKQVRLRTCPEICTPGLRELYSLLVRTAEITRNVIFGVPIGRIACVCQIRSCGKDVSGTRKELSC